MGGLKKEVGGNGNHHTNGIKPEQMKNGSAVIADTRFLLFSEIMLVHNLLSNQN